MRRDGAEDLCLGCRSERIARAEAQARRAAASSAPVSLLPVRRFRRSLIYVVLPLGLALAVMTGVAANVLSDARSARAEQRAEAVLEQICDAETAWRKRSGDYASLDELVSKNLIGPQVQALPAYEVHIELSADRKLFWVRAIPTVIGVRGMCRDSNGKLVYEGTR